MVRIRKPVVRSENLIDLSTKSGAAGRATNRLIRALDRKKAAADAADMLDEALRQAMKMRNSRPR